MSRGLFALLLLHHVMRYLLPAWENGGAVALRVRARLFRPHPSLAR